MFVGIGKESGRKVPKEEAFQYAIARSISDPVEWEAFKQSTVEWYFSGDWIEEEGEEEIVWPTKW